MPIDVPILTSFYAGLRAKEIAALTVGNVFDEAGSVREQFILTAEQSKGGHHTAGKQGGRGAAIGGTGGAFAHIDNSKVH